MTTTNNANNGPSGSFLFNGVSGGGRMATIPGYHTKNSHNAVLADEHCSDSAIVPETQQKSQSLVAAVVKDKHKNYSAKGHYKMSSSYDLGRLLGNGSFGIVCEARCSDTGEQVAVKKVLQDPRYKNRELDIMKELSHPNIVELRDYFYTEVPTPGGNGERGENTQRFLNVVMEHISETVYRVLKTFVRNNQPFPMLLVRLYTYQLCRSLGYLHSLGICHRDIKPQNLLVDSKTHVLKLCDFGSAKRLVRSEHSVAYICSRFYRAPELMLGATDYTTAIDLWSIGCVLGELLLGRPLFSGETSVDQLVRIIQVRGTPTPRQMQAMNPNYQEFKFPDVQPRSWRQVMNSAVGGNGNIPDEALDLLTRFLNYEPSARLTAYEALAHPFFDSLRDPNCRMPEGSVLPELFNFSESELQCMSPTCREIVVPEWYSFHRSTADSSSATTPVSTSFSYPNPSISVPPIQSSAQQPQQSSISHWKQPINTERNYRIGSSQAFIGSSSCISENS